MPRSHARTWPGPDWRQRRNPVSGARSNRCELADGGSRARSDFTFIDDDKPSIPNNFGTHRAVAPAALIPRRTSFAQGKVIEAASATPRSRVCGASTSNARPAIRAPSATTIQNVGSKGYDGWSWPSSSTPRPVIHRRHVQTESLEWEAPTTWREIERLRSGARQSSASSTCRSVRLSAWDRFVALEIALYRTYCVPSISALLDRTGEFRRAARRSATTTPRSWSPRCAMWGYLEGRGKARSSG
jgi:hypothetical protein